jgi:formylglycine-generating enzyme required for sulfatase activity
MVRASWPQRALEGEGDQPVLAVGSNGVRLPGDSPDSAGTAAVEFAKAGICARCHVVSVLEWSISGHVAADTRCESCHGPSTRHVANERNQVKPDRLPRGAAIAQQLCSTCHEQGCPQTSRVNDCQTCHHVHALVHPSDPPKTDERLQAELTRWAGHERAMASGQHHVDQQDWQAASEAFRVALALYPDDTKARRRLEMCLRRMTPGLPGFRAVGDRIDAETGLPCEVFVEGFESTISMRLVPSGEFEMGSADVAESQPVHSLRIDAFYLGACELTQAEWKSVLATNPSAHDSTVFADADRMPVERISWQDCQAFVQRCNERVPGGGFRLPSEAEWEYACRAGDGQAFDQDAMTSYAWSRETTMRIAKPDAPFLELDALAPSPVGQLRPNAWGFYDMQGNVWEWTSSLWRPYAYNPADGRESLAAIGMRVLRGGGYADPKSLFHPALRHGERPYRRLRWNGMRLARSVPEL